MSSVFRGVLINDEHTLRDWGAAITNSDVISMPEPNTTYLEIPGRNGRLDLSESLTGDVTFSNRTIKLQLAKARMWRTGIVPASTFLILFMVAL